MLELHVEPRITKEWDGFLKEKPQRSIALDGYVKGPSAFEPNGLYANFNHHEGVDRFATRSTAGQVYLAIMQSFLKPYRKGGSVNAHLFVNDPDEDVCLSVWLLRNWEQAETPSKQLGRLVNLADILDTTSGACPIDTSSAEMRHHAWIFEPYNEARLARKLHSMDREEMAVIIDRVGGRITRYLSGKGEGVVLDVRYDIIGGGQGWALVVERGAYARTKMVLDGITAFVSARTNADGTFTYSYCSVSPYNTEFPVPELYTVLNRAEGISESSIDCHGGGNTIGGSPRMAGSKLNPKELEKIINKFLAKKRA